MGALGNMQTLAGLAIWGIMLVLWEVFDPQLPLYADLAIIFGLMPIFSGVLAWFLAGRSVLRSGTGIPVDRGDGDGYSIQLVEKLEDWRDVNRVEGIVMHYSAVAGKLSKSDLVAGARVFSGVPEIELPDLVRQFETRGISVRVERENLER